MSRKTVKPNVRSVNLEGWEIPLLEDELEKLDKAAQKDAKLAAEKAFADHYIPFHRNGEAFRLLVLRVAADAIRCMIDIDEQHFIDLAPMKKGVAPLSIRLQLLPQPDEDYQVGGIEWIVDFEDALNMELASNWETKQGRKVWDEREKKLRQMADKIASQRQFEDGRK